jgi:hypothetical protein
MGNFDDGHRNGVHGMDADREYLSYSELSKLSGFSESTLSRRARDGAIQKIQPGGPRTRVVFRRDVLDQLPKVSPATCPPTRTPAGTSDTPAENPSPSLPGPRPLWQRPT